MITVRCEQINDALWALSTPRYDEGFKQIAKRFPGGVWSGVRKAWIGYSDWAALVYQTLESDSEHTLQGDPPSVKALSVPQNLTEQERGLRDYQKIGLAFLLAHAKEGVLLGDDMATGKTRTALLAALRCELPVVIISPAVIKYVWVAEGKKVGIDVLPLEGIQPADGLRIGPEDGFVVLNYDIVHAWLEALKGARTIIFDECHALINQKSKRSESCKALAHKAKYRIALSGTPITTTVKNLWNIVDTISPKRFGERFFTGFEDKFNGFGMRYCEGHQKTIELKEKGETKQVWDFNGSSHLDELNRRLKHFYLRRTKEEVNLELPPKTRQAVEIDVGIDAQTDYSWERISSVRHAFQKAAYGKMAAIVELVIEAIDAGRRVVVFTYEHKVAHTLESKLLKKGIEVFMATGELQAKERFAIIDLAAKTAGSVLVATIKAMGEGIDLTYADHGIVAELVHTPSTLLQAEARFHRPGQKNHVFFQYTIGIGTIDEKVRDIVLSRMESIDQVLGGNTTDDMKQGIMAKSDDEILAELREALLKGD